MDMLFGSSDLKICPNCAEEFHPGECRIVSQIHPGTVLKLAPTTWLERQRARHYPEPLIGPLYVKELACRECPHCNYPLPYNIESVQAKSIVVVGDTYSGKSHFIAALITQIQAGLIQNPNHSTRFVCLTPKVLEKYTQDYLNTLFKKKGVIPHTQAASPITPIEPLIYELIVKKSPAHPAKRTNLILYDASGEDYANADRLVQHTRYVLHASGMIFLADPVSMPDILDRLAPHLQKHSVTGRRASDVLNSTIQLLEKNRGLEPGSTLMQIPIAITLSKSDLLKYLRGINDTYSFLSNPKNGYTSGVDLQDLENVDREVRQLLADFGDRTLLDATSTLNVQFFAASATGHAPDINQTYPVVEPRRCLDPVLWLLYQLQVIDAQ